MIIYKRKITHEDASNLDKDEAIQFRTYNAKALKVVIDEKIDDFYKN